MDEIVTLTFVIEPEDDRFVATCRELDIASSGRTVEDAVQHVLNAVALYLEVLEEDGERERIFRERGIEVAKGMPASYHLDVPAGVFATLRQIQLKSPLRA